jgi:phosphoserine phosphatase
MSERIGYAAACREAVRSMTGEAESIAVYGEQPPVLLLDSIAALRELAGLIAEAEKHVAEEYVNNATWNYEAQRLVESLAAGFQSARAETGEGARER